MSERAFPLDNIEYYSDDMRMFHAGRYSGIVGYTDNDFGISNVDGMKVKILPGVAYLKAGRNDIGGVVYKSDSEESFTFEPAGSSTRYDYISIRYDSADNNVKLGKYRGSNAYPVPLRESSVYELIIYVIEIPANANRILMSNVKDVRLNEDFCGYAVDTLAKIPTDQYNDQFYSFMEEINRALGEDTAGKIMLQIKDLQTVSDSQADDIMELKGLTNTHTNQITGIQNQDKSQNTEISNLKTTTTNVNNSVNTLKTDVTNLKNKDTSLQNSINNLQSQINTLKNQIAKPLTAYPVGAIYISANSTNPASLFGGTWTRISQGRCLVGEGSVRDSSGNSKNFPMGSSGGLLQSTLLAGIGTINQATDQIGYAPGPVIPNVGYQLRGIFASSGSMTGSPTHSTRVYEADGNMPSKVQPYFVVAIWQRTA